MLKPLDQLRIIAFLKRFGCNHSESLAYIETLKMGMTSTLELSRKLKKNRITIYYSVQQLIEKGFLFEIRKGKKRFLVAENPDIIMKIIDQRHNELKALETDASYITQLLNSVHTAPHEITVVKLYEETEGFKKMLEESLEAKNGILVLSNTALFSKMLGEDYYENYFARKSALGIQTSMIYPPCSFVDRIKNKQREYKIDLRILPQALGSEAGFYVWNNTVAIKSLKENKRSCTIIENKDIACFFRENIFNPFWAQAKPAEPT